MKRNICIIGPLPPPITGNSKAIETIIKSSECNNLFEFFTVNLSVSELKNSGVFSLVKLKMVVDALKSLTKIQSQVIIDTYYLTIAQSSFGCLRDIILLHKIYKSKAKATVVLHLHGGGFQNFYLKSNLLIKFLIKKYYSKANTCIVLSNSLKSMFNGIIDENKIQVVENCVDNEFIISNELINRKLYEVKSKNLLRVVYLSNMIKTKGYLDLLYAAKILHDKNIYCKFIFAGMFQNQLQQDEFYAFVENNDLGKYIDYVGIVEKDDKKSVLMNGDIFVLPTYYPPEGQPISILEAMASGMPVITTKQGGIPDVIDDEINGIFIPPQSPDKIAEAILKFVNNPECIEKMGKNNRKKITEKYMEIHYIKSIIDILNN